MKNYNIIKAAAISELMEKIAYQPLFTIPKSTQPDEAPETRVPNIFGKTKIERGEAPREAQLFKNQINPLFGDDRPIRADQILRDAALPVTPRNPLGKTPKARGEAPPVGPAQKVTLDNMDDIIQQASLPSPQYVQKMMSQGKDPVVPANASYAVNPSLGNTGAPARAIPVGPVEAPAAPVKVAPDFNALFKEQHASSFDPNSSMDRLKMQKLKARLGI
jgi:hypothetical protein